MIGSNGDTKVRTASRSTGGEAMIERSRTPVSASCKVRGIGVAVSVSTCTSLAQRLELLLVRDAEMLLLVHHQQRQVLELDRLAEQRMGADDDIDVAGGQAGFHRLELRRRHQPRGMRHVHREAAKSFGECLEMLACQQRGRHHHGHLPAVDGRDEGGA